MEYNFSKEKTIELINKIKSKLIEEKNIIEKANELNKKEWGCEINVDQLLEKVDLIAQKEYLPKFSKAKIVDGYGKILMYDYKQNPYLIFEFILSCLYTNNKVTIALFDKNLAINKIIIELIIKALEDLKLNNKQIVDYVEIKELNTLILIQNEFDLLYYLGNKKEYIDFIKRFHIDTKYANYGEIDVYVKSSKFKNIIIDFNIYAIENGYSLKMYSDDLAKSMEKMNENNNVNRISVIYTDDIENAYEFIKKIKSENIFINLKDFTKIKYEIDLNSLVFEKNINLK